MSERLGPYEIRGELGRGAMAVVWRGYDPTLDREVALKEPFVAPGTDPAVVEELAARFIREGRAAARLNHPGIVTIYGADTYDGRPAISMELIDGETLSQIIDRGALPVEVVVSIVDQLLDAVGYAHASGVVHRDIKPDNVFVTRDGRAKLADFGIAHVGTDSQLTMAGAVMGTPGYMSPEQVAGQSTDARSDLFAVGVMCHEMLTGRNPFGATDGHAATTVMYRIVHEPLPPLARITPTGTDLDAVLTVATAKDPLQRFPDAVSFRRALAGGAVPTIIPGTYPPPVEVSRRSGSASWLPYAIVGGVGVLVIGALLMTAGGAPTGASAGGPVAPAVPTAAVPAAEVVPPAPEPEPAAPTDDESYAALQDTYLEIKNLGTEKTGLVGLLAPRFSGSSAFTREATQLCDTIRQLQDEVRDMPVSPAYEQVKQVQIELLGYCFTRTEMMRQGSILQAQGGDPTGLLDQGRDAKNAYNRRVAAGQP